MQRRRTQQRVVPSSSPTNKASRSPPDRLATHRATSTRASRTGGDPAAAISTRSRSVLRNSTIAVCEPVRASNDAGTGGSTASSWTSPTCTLPDLAIGKTQYYSISTKNYSISTKACPTVGPGRISVKASVLLAPAQMITGACDQRCRGGTSLQGSGHMSCLRAANASRSSRANSPSRSTAVVCRISTSTDQ